MLKLKRFLLSSLLLLFAFYSVSYATEIDLIYNLSGPDGSDCEAAWHGARIAKHILHQNGTPIHLVLYNGQSVSKLNAAIGKICAQSKSTPIVIGLGTQQEITAAAQPLLAANKIFIAAGNIGEYAEKTELGDHFFFVSAKTTREEDPARARFNKLYQERFHQEPTDTAYKGFNAVMLAATALGRTTNHSSLELAQTIKRLTENDSLSSYPLLTTGLSRMKNLS
jgi:hypothetical protein